MSKITASILAIKAQLGKYQHKSMNSHADTCDEKSFSLKERLRLILDLSESMLIFAKNDEWENLIEIEPKRQSHLQQFSALSSSADELTWVRQSLERILEIDKHVIQLSVNRKQTLVETKKTFSKSQAASKAYSQSNILP